MEMLPFPCGFEAVFEGVFELLWLTGEFRVFVLWGTSLHTQGLGPAKHRCPSPGHQSSATPGGDRGTSFPSHLRSGMRWARGLSSASHGIHPTPSPRGFWGAFFHHSRFPHREHRLLGCVPSLRTDPTEGASQPPPGRTRSAENRRRRFFFLRKEHLPKAPQIPKPAPRSSGSEALDTEEKRNKAANSTCSELLLSPSGRPRTECKAGNYSGWDFLPS